MSRRKDQARELPPRPERREVGGRDGVVVLADEALVDEVLKAKRGKA